MHTGTDPLEGTPTPTIMSSESLRLPLPVCGRAGANWVGGQVGLAQQTSYVSKLRFGGLENIITVALRGCLPEHRTKKLTDTPAWKCIQDACRRKCIHLQL